MSSQTDIQAPDAYIARITRLEAQLTIGQEQSASRIRELEQTVTDLKVELHLSSSKPTDSSDPVLRAEISRLQQALASKDAEFNTLYRKHSDLIKSITSLAAAAEIPPEEATPKIEVTGTGRSSFPVVLRLQLLRHQAPQR